MKYTRITVGLAAVAAGVMLAGCTVQQSGTGDDEGDALVVGIATAQSGWQAAFDAPGIAGLKLAIEKQNAAGGVNGVPIEVVEVDTESDAAIGSTAVTSVIEQGADVVIVTSNFDLAAPGVTVATDQGKLVYSPAAASPLFGTLGPLVYTMATSIEAEGALLARWADRQGYESVSLLLDTTAQYNADECTGFTAEFESLGGSIASESTFANDDSSLATQVTAIREASPDAVLLCTYPPGGATALLQLRNGGVDAPLIGNDTFDGTSYLSSVPGLSDFYYATYASIFGDDPDAAVNDLVAEYEEFTGGSAENSYFLSGYSTIEAIVLAAEQAGSFEGAALAAALDTFNGVDLAIGETTITADDHVNSTRPMAIIEVTDGTPAFLTSSN